MKPPGFLTALIGNPISALVIMLGALFVGYQWLAGEISGWMALAAVIAASYAAKASDRVNSYSAWQREWQAMSGEMPTRLTLPRLDPLRVLGGIAVWLIGAWFALEEANTPGLQIPLGMFWLGSLLMIGYGLYRFAARLRGARSRSDGAARVALSRPFQSPSTKEAYSALPEYCWGLFQQR